MICERLLVRGVELDRVTLRVERDDCAARPATLGARRWRLELDAHLAKDAHGTVAERLEQSAGGRVDLERAGHGSCVRRGWPRALQARSRSAFRSRARARQDGRTPSASPELAFVAHRPVADDPVAIADDARVLA